jgi:hypothetical protein
MAFGKDDSQLGQMSTYRQAAMTHMNSQKTARKNSGGGGGGMPTWIDQFKPSKVNEDLIRLIPSPCEITTAQDKDTAVTRTLPFMSYTEHFYATAKKGCTCSAGPFGQFKEKREPCRGCDMFWEFRTEDGKPGAKVSKRDMFAFTVLHYAPYARVPDLDMNGQPRTDQEGKPYMRWERILKHERAKYTGYEQKDAHRLHWPMGTAHYGVLWEYDAKIGKSCTTCGGRDCIESVAWICSNPACGEGIIDIETTTYPPEEITKMTMQPHTCSVCKVNGFLKEVIFCKNCSPIGKEPRRATLFDVDIHVQRKEANDGSNQTALLITGWGNPGPVDPRYADMAKPLALSKIYAPTPMDVQVQRFGPATPPRTPVNNGTTQYSR